jgi:methyl-accepting chemotaxis protein
VAAPAGQAEPDAIVKTAAGAGEAGAALWKTMAGELDGLLEARLADRRSARMWALLVSGLALAAAQVLVFFLSRSINAQLAVMGQSLGHGAREVSLAATEVAQSAQSLSQDASDQAASLEETSASMEEMSSMTSANAGHAESAAQVMGAVTDRVNELRGALRATVAAMGGIEESSQKVSKIIRTVDDIALQTNILALNAAVEAARAGEAGMGFAVVADEVRSLAQRASKAAKETAALIDESLKCAAGGASNVAEVDQSVQSIGESMASVKRLVDEVSVASRQQAQGIEQVSQALARMEKVTQKTAATAEESAATSEELNAQAETALAIVAEMQHIVAGAADATGPAMRRKGSVTEARSGLTEGRRAA